MDFHQHPPCHNAVCCVNLGIFSVLLLLPSTSSIGTMTWNLSRTCSPLIQIASRSPRLFQASPCFRTCPDAAGSRTSETWSFPRVLITPCSCLIATSLTSLALPTLIALCQSLLCLCFLVGRHTCTEAKPYGRRVCTVGLSEALGELALPLLLQCAPIGWDSIFNYTVPRYFSVRLLPSLTTPQGWRRGIERSCCSPLKVHRNQRDCWKNILQVQVECCTGELNSVLYFAK